MIPKLELVNYNDKLYYVYRKIRENHIKEGFINDVKEYWECDIVLKRKTETESILFFLCEIPEAIIIEDDVDKKD